ncbi:ribosomal protein S6 kinase delta-1-like [Asterias amurensis]|uniref:ribosomal protein S6 kinase delta-1-like n=1 Tax=Asterias amurensis TaxID=7602 RepID=UPI003AB17E4E
MAAPSGRSKDNWIRSFLVTDPTTHQKGFTVYKVTYRAFSLNKPEDVTEIVVWKRYNDFKKLNKALSLLHYNLRRPEKFPVFAKAKFFGRFDDEVVEERRQSALRLLEFVVSIPPLTRSNYFRSFFEGGEEVALRQSPRREILQPKKVSPEFTSGKSQSPGHSHYDSGASTPSEGRDHVFLTEGQPSPSLGGVWLHRQNEEDVSEYGTVEYDDDDDDRTTFSEDSVPSTPLPQLQELSFFDPLSDTEPPGVTSEGSSIPQSNSWLFQAMDMCAVLNEESQDSQENSTAANSTTDLSSDSGITINFSKAPTEAPPVQLTPTNESNWKGQENQEGWTVVPPESSDDSKDARNSMARAYLHCIRAQQAAERDAMYTDGGIVDSRSPQAKPALDETDNRGVAGMTIGGAEDYLYQAAYHISLALDNETNGNYQAAFDLYKSGVGVLLKGVIGDDNKTRREAVRRKTAQYLMKAEDLYNQYLSAEVTNYKRWESEHPCIDVDPRSAHLRGSEEELKNYKVLGLIDSVLLVLDSISYQTFIIKVLQKCSVATKRTIAVPAYCSYVAKLYKFIETDNAIYLILEHASGGKLWNYASGYLSHGAEKSVNQAMVSSLERSIGSCGSRRSRHSTTSSKDDKKHREEICEENVFQEPEMNPQGLIPSLENQQQVSVGGQESEGGGNSYANLMIDYVEKPNQEVLTPDPIASEFAELDIQDTEANLNDLVNQCSQYDIVYNDVNEATRDWGGETNGQTNRGLSIPSHNVQDLNSNAPINLFSIDSQESPGSELHSVGSDDKNAFAFESPKGSPKAGPVVDEVFSNVGRIDSNDVKSQPALSTWVDHNPEDVIADAMKVMQDLEQEDELDFNLIPLNNTASEVTESNSLISPSTTKLDTLPDTSGFASAMTDELTSSQPGTDLAEFFDTNTVASTVPFAESFTRPTPLQHSMSMQEQGVSRDSPLSQRKYSNPMDFKVRSATFEEKRPDDGLSSLLKVDTSIDDGGFGSASVWETSRADTSKSEPNLGKMLSEAASSRGTDTLEPDRNSNKPNLPKDLYVKTSDLSSNQTNPPLLPSVTTPSSLSPNQESIDTTLYSSCESTPKHTIYSPDWDSGTVMDSPTIESPDQHTANQKTTIANSDVYVNVNRSDMDRTKDDSDITPTHNGAPLRKTISPPSANDTKKPTPIINPRDAPLPSLSTLFSQMDEQVKVTKSNTLPESCVRLWAAEILLALTDLHAVGIICQDLRPDNILLAEGGHIRLTYFSQWQYVERTLNPFAKEHFYTAPEVNGIFNVTPTCDWWSFGALLYELLTGMSLHSCHPSGIGSHTQLIIPDHVSPEASSLIKQLLQANPNERLGSHRAGGAEEIRLHPFFKDVNWMSLQKSAHS